MDTSQRLTYIGGPTALLEIDGLRLFAPAAIIPLHYEGWAHFTESRGDIAQAFRKAGLEARLRWFEPGRATTLAG